MIITQTFTVVRWQIVVKRSEATKQNKDQTTTKQKTKTKSKTNKQTKQQTKTKTKEQKEQNRTMGAEGYKANNYSNVIINIDLRETHTEGDG